MRKRRIWAALAAVLVMGAVVAVSQAVTTGGIASAAVGTFSKAEVNFPANSGLTGATPGLKKFNDVQAGGTATDVSLVLKSVDGASNDWVIDLQPVNGTSGTFSASNNYVNSLIGADATHMRAHLHVANPTGPSCGEQFGHVRIRWVDASAAPIPSIALDFKIRCGSTVTGEAAAGPEISGSVMYKVAQGPIDDPAAGEFTPVTPFRVYDSRNTTAFNAGEARNIAIPSPVPNTAIAVVLNVTAINPPDWGYLTAYPTGGSRPFASNLNFKPLQTVPNSVIVKLGTGNSIAIYNGTGSGATHVAVDVMGYFDPTVVTDSGRYAPLDPYRVLDTRLAGGTAFSDEFRPLNIDVSGVSSTVKSVILNVTVAGVQRGGYLGVTPGNTPPTSPTSNLNFNPGDTAPNLVVVGATPDATIANRYHAGITVGGRTDVVVDLVGIFTTDRSTGAGKFVPIDPQRIMDTRTAGGPLGPTENRDLTMLRLLGRYSAEGNGLVFNGTAVNATAPTYMKFWPTDQQPGYTSNLNLGTGETRANLVIMGADLYGLTSVFNAAGSTDLVADAAGWFTR